MGPTVCYGPGAISMKEDWVQGAPLHLHTQLHTHFVPHTTAAVKDCPLQLSLRVVYRYLSPWYGVQNTPMGQRVKVVVVNWIAVVQVMSSSRKQSDVSWGSTATVVGEERTTTTTTTKVHPVPAWVPALLILIYILLGRLISIRKNKNKKSEYCSTFITDMVYGSMLLPSRVYECMYICKTENVTFNILHIL